MCNLPCRVATPQERRRTGRGASRTSSAGAANGEGRAAREGGRAGHIRSALGRKEGRKSANRGAAAGRRSELEIRVPKRERETLNSRLPSCWGGARKNPNYSGGGGAGRGDSDGVEGGERRRQESEP